VDLPPFIWLPLSPRRANCSVNSPSEYTVVPSDAMEVHDDQLTAREIRNINAYRKRAPSPRNFRRPLVLGATRWFILTPLSENPRTGGGVSVLKQLSGHTLEVRHRGLPAQLRNHRQKLF